MFKEALRILCDLVFIMLMSCIFFLSLNGLENKPDIRENIVLAIASSVMISVFIELVFGGEKTSNK